MQQQGFLTLLAMATCSTSSQHGFGLNLLPLLWLLLTVTEPPPAAVIAAAAAAAVVCFRCGMRRPPSPQAMVLPCWHSGQPAKDTRPEAAAAADETGHWFSATETVASQLHSGRLPLLQRLPLKCVLAISERRAFSLWQHC